LQFGVNGITNQKKAGGRGLAYFMNFYVTNLCEYRITNLHTGILVLCNIHLHGIHFTWGRTDGRTRLHPHRTAPDIHCYQVLSSQSTVCTDNRVGSNPVLHWTVLERSQQDLSKPDILRYNQLINSNSFSMQCTVACNKNY